MDVHLKQNRKLKFITGFQQLILAPKNNTDMQLVVSMTGFVHDPSLPKYQQMLQQLGCRYAEQLSNDVNYLIINHVCTEKYKIAQLNKSSIQCIKNQWLQDSLKGGQPLPIEKYKIDKIFYGVRIIVQGFQDKSMLSQIKQVLINNGVVEIREGVQGMLTQQLNQRYQLLLVPNAKLYRKLEPKISDFIMIPLVTPEWIEQSILSKKCKYPNDYALNLSNLSTKQFNDNTNTRRLNKKLQSFMQLDFLNINTCSKGTKNKKNLLCDPQLGQQMIIYLDHNSIEKTFMDLLKKLICVNGGLYLNNYGPIVTHILVGQIQQSEYLKFFNYGDSCHILRVQWLIDSILFAEKLPQIDFKVRSFKSALTKSMNIMELKELKNGRNMHSQTFVHSFNDANPFNSRNMAVSMNLIAPTTLEPKFNRKNISVSKEPIKPVKIIPTKLKVIKTEIFKGKYFLVEKSQKKQLNSQIPTKIKQNGGNVLNDNYLKDLKNRKIYVVLKDSDKNKQLLDQLNNAANKDKNGKDNNLLIPVSPRWIDECIKKSQFIELCKEANFFTFKPFNFQTPLRQLMAMKFQLLVVDETLKRRYKQLLIALGANKVSPSISTEITHYLCEQKYQIDTIYNSLTNLKYNSPPEKQKQKQTASKDQKPKSIKFVKIQWLTDLVSSTQKKVNIQDYIIKICKRVD